MFENWNLTFIHCEWILVNGEHDYNQTGFFTISYLAENCQIAYREKPKWWSKWQNQIRISTLSAWYLIWFMYSSTSLSPLLVFIFTVYIYSENNKLYLQDLVESARLLTVKKQDCHRECVFYLFKFLRNRLFWWYLTLHHQFPKVTLHSMHSINLFTSDAIIRRSAPTYHTL